MIRDTRHAIRVTRECETGGDVAEQLTIGPMARQCGILETHLRKLCERGKVPFRRTGRYYAFDPKDAAKVRAAAVKAGYLPDPPHAAACPA